MITVTRSSLSMEVGDLSNPALAACAARLYVAVADALVHDPPTIYVALLRAIRELLPVTGVSLSSIGFPEGDGNSVAPFQDWRFEERDVDGGKLKQKKLGTLIAENEKTGVTIDESLRGAEERLLGVIAGDVSESSNVFLHWLLFDGVGVALCLYRIANSGDDPGYFTPEELECVEALAPFLARGLRLDVVFKLRASGYEFFTRRTLEVSEQLGLTNMEYRVLHKVVIGSDNGSIAKDLSVSVATVKTHITHILQKSGCRNRNALLGRYFSSVEALSL